MAPRLLDVVAGSEAARCAFLQGWSAVPLLAFLPWAATMLSLLGQDAGGALLPLLKVGLPRCGASCFTAPCPTA